MKKIIIKTLALIATSGIINNIYATDDYAALQKFDNSISIGFGIEQTTLSNGLQNQSLQQNQNMDLNVEKLFDNGLWANINAYMMMSTNSLGNQAIGTGMGYGQPASQNPSIGGFNAKLGYGLKLFDNYQLDYLITPYAIFGRNTNLSMSAIFANGQTNVTNDFFYTAGFGLRAEYLINEYVQIYLDQAFNYNWDQSAPLNGIQPQNNEMLTTMLGLKFNVYENLQLGIGGFLNNYQYLATAPNYSSITGGSNPNGGSVSIYQPQYDLGATFSVGMTF